MKELKMALMEATKDVFHSPNNNVTNNKNWYLVPESAVHIILHLIILPNLLPLVSFDEKRWYYRKKKVPNKI